MHDNYLDLLGKVCNSHDRHALNLCKKNPRYHNYTFFTFAGKYSKGKYKTLQLSVSIILCLVELFKNKIEKVYDCHSKLQTHFFIVINSV